MISKTMKSENVRLARVRYYDVERNGLEVDDINAYAFLLKTGTSYINIFDMTSNYPVFDRVPYSNTTKNGEDYGTKVIQISGDPDKSGLCYVLEATTGKSLFNLDEVTDELLKIYMIHSNKFFVDRMNILQESPSLLQKIGNLPKLVADEKKHARLQKLVDSHQTEKRY